jgi:serine/threonine-protein kinase
LLEDVGMVAADGPKPGDVLAGKYVLRERLGEGGMGRVFLADQPALARSVAIKVLLPQLRSHQWIARRFREEAIAASRVKHPGAISVIDCHLSAGVPFIVMEHVDGRPLGHLIAEQEIPLPRALAIVDRILDVVAAVHAAGVVHGDIKSDNLLVDERRDGDVVTLIDFGLARFDGSWTETDWVSGTPDYMAPELARGQPPTPSSDVYGVAVVLYELLTGKTPFGGGTAAEILTRQIEDVVIPPSLRQPAREIPTALDAIVMRALAKDPEVRFADAEELRRALRTVVIRKRACPRCGTSLPPPARFCDRCGTVLRSASSQDPQPIGSKRRTETPTRPRTVPRGRFARGSDASAFVREQRISDAVRELEKGLGILAAGDRPRLDAAQRARIAVLVAGL